jgi:hypothetical protein
MLTTPIISSVGKSPMFELCMTRYYILPLALRSKSSIFELCMTVLMLISCAVRNELMYDWTYASETIVLVLTSSRPRISGGAHIPVWDGKCTR